MPSKKRAIVQQVVGEMGRTAEPVDFDSLIKAIIQVHERLQFQAVKAVNACLTLRNWLIGCYIHEYEQKGKDRATYGEHLLDSLAQRLERNNIPRSSARELRRYRQFYLVYPQIRESLTPESYEHLTGGTGSEKDDNSDKKRELVTPESVISGKLLVERLSFTHIAELLQIEEPLKRHFYETECIRGNWSVRDLKRQIASLYYERSGLSKDKKKLSRIVQSKAEQISTSQIIRDPYVFEFLGLKPKEVMSESALEDSFLDKLQDFLLELGRGFCFEARQKRILIGDEYYFVDLIFYHRILKCHVLIELKVAEFSHEYLGQLNTYVNWYRAHETVKGDNPPIGILLCTSKNHALVKYALAGMNNRLFVSKYQLQLPKKEEIRRFLEGQIKSEVVSEKRK